MKLLIIGKYAHRTLNNGKVESAPLTTLDNGNPIIDMQDFRSRDPKEMNMTGAQLIIIGNALLNMRNLIREEAQPSINVSTKVGQNPVAVA